MNSLDKVITSLNKSVFSKSPRIIFDVSEELDTFIQGDVYQDIFIKIYSEKYKEASEEDCILILDFSSVINVGTSFLNNTLTFLVKNKLITSEELDSKIFIKGSKLFISNFKESLKRLESGSNPEDTKSKENLAVLLESKKTYESYKRLLETSTRDRDTELVQVKETLVEIDLKLKYYT